MENKIDKISVKGFLKKFNLEINLDPSVTILFGSNGSGKSTLLNLIPDDFTDEGHNSNGIKNVEVEVFFKGSDLSYLIKNNKWINKSNFDGNFSFNIKHIKTFDIPNMHSSRAKSELLKQLEKLIFAKDSNKELNFNDFQLAHLKEIKNDSEKAKVYADNEGKFFEIINDFFEPTAKKIKIGENTIYFDMNGSRIDLEHLSSEEKQLLIILFTVYMMDKKPFVLVMDEPEISMHMAWQEVLIDRLLEINPELQIIIATHSPSLLVNGWKNKLLEMKLFLN